MSEYNGLKVKYNVTKVKDGTPVFDCFVLRPQIDEAAKAALRTYAESTTNQELARDLFWWLNSLDLTETCDNQDNQVSGGSNYMPVKGRYEEAKGVYNGLYTFPVGHHSVSVLISDTGLDITIGDEDESL